MNREIRKLLRGDLSWGQLAGAFLANLLGMAIVLWGCQFYQDVYSIFAEGDSFMKEEQLVIGKRVTTTQTLMGGHPVFSPQEIVELEQQPFVKGVGAFLPALFDIQATIGSQDLGIAMTTDMFFESIPDRYVDADLSQWQYQEGSDSVPIILPRHYLNLYNFGYAGPRGLPVLSESLVSMIRLKFYLRGTKAQQLMHGRVVAFSDRLNTILVPHDFMLWANQRLSPDQIPTYSRLVVEVTNLADERIATYLAEHPYEEEGNAADAGRTAYFLRLIVGIVLVVGLVICLLSFYLLLLSIYLLLQRNTEKIDLLLLLGYCPTTVALPFQLLSLLLHTLVLGLSILGVIVLRNYYLPLIGEIYPQLQTEGIGFTLGIGITLFLIMELLNFVLVRRKVVRIWSLRQEKE